MSPETNSEEENMEEEAVEVPSAEIVEEVVEEEVVASVEEASPETTEEPVEEVAAFPIEEDNVDPIDSLVGSGSPEQLIDVADPEPKLEDKLVIISSLPTKNIKSARRPFVDCDKLVLEWYLGRSGGQQYTIEEAAIDLGIPVEEMKNSFVRLRNNPLKETLDHITDYPVDPHQNR